jgi:hypothetical protein
MIPVFLQNSTYKLMPKEYDTAIFYLYVLLTLNDDDYYLFKISYLPQHYLLNLKFCI